MKTIFVSSTFQDMHYERDIIHDRVTPALNTVARQYGESVSFCDLRWGVNTGELESEEGSRKVLSVCLEEIDRCRPYMLVILGDRYGWIPDEGLIADAASRAKFALEELEQSVTALEIEYGALSNPEQLERTLFYFREFAEEPPTPYRSEDPHHAAKLEALKGRIRKLAGGRLKTYTLGWDPAANRPEGLEQFAVLVESDVRGLMEQEWKETAALTPYQRDQRGQWDYAARKARQFSAREDFVSECIAMLDGDTNLLALQGVSGTGKSTLMARLAQVLKERGDGVLPIFCATTPLCNNSLDLVRYIVNDLEERLTLPHLAPQSGDGLPGEQEWIDQLEDLVAAYNTLSKGRLIILIDGVDQLSADELRDQLRFIPYNLSSKVQMVLACLSEFHLSRPMWVKEVAPLAAEDRPEIIRGILGFLGRELDQPVIDVMVQKPAAHSPLYLSLVVQRLAMMNKADFDEIVAQGDGMAAITRHQLELVEGCSDTLEGMCVDILSAASRRVGGPFVQAAAEYLAASRHGLRERDLEGLLTARGIPWSGLDFARFVQYLNTFFILREDGRYDFAHQSIRRGVLAQCRDVQQLHWEILAHLQTLDRRDGVRLREFGYHCILAGDFEALACCVAGAGDDEEALTFLARDAHDLARKDGGKWLRTLFRRGLALGVGHAFVDFVNAQLSRSFGDSQTELNLARDVLELGLELAWQVNDRDRTAQSRRDLAASYEKVGSVYETLGGRSNLERALELYQKGLEYYEALAQTQDTAESCRDLAFSFGELGGVYVALGGQENLEQALALYQKGMELSEALAREQGTPQSRRDLTLSYNSVGEVYEALGGRENLERARALYQRGLELRVKLVWEQSPTLSLRDLAISYERLGGVYETLEGLRNLKQARDLHQKSLDLREFLVRELGTVRSRRDLSVSYEQMGLVYETLGGRENLKQARALHQKGLELREALARELGTAQSRRDLAVSYERMGGVYAALGGRENLKQAQALHQKSLELREVLVREQNTAQSRRDLAISYEQMGGLYQALGGRANLELALERYQKSIALREALVRELGTAQSRRDLSVSYERMGFVYETLGGRKNLELALERYQKSIALRKALVREQNTAQSRRDLAVAYDKVGEVYEVLGDRENLERALELYQRGLELLEALVRALGTARSRRDLAISYEKIGDVYKALGGRENLEQAREWYQKELKRTEALARELGTPQGRRDLSVSYDKVGGVYMALGGRENLERALELYQKGLDLVESLVRELDTPQSRRDLAISYEQMGGIYETLGGRENLERALELYQKELELIKSLARELDTAQSCRDLSVSYERMGGVYAALGGRENLSRALELYQRDLELRETLAREQNTAQSRRDLAVAYDKVGGIHKALGGREDLERALELYQKGMEDSKALVRELGTAQSRRDLAFCYNQVGEIYEALGGQANLERARALYQKGLDLSEALAQALNTISAYDDLAVSYYKMGFHLPEGSEERRRYSMQFLELSQQLYRQTHGQRHQTMVSVARRLLGEAEPE